MSRKSASERYDRQRRKILDQETRILKGNSSGIFETVLAYPGVYSLGMSSLYFHSLFNQLSSWPDTRCERAFFPEQSEHNWRRRVGRPVVTLDSGKPISESDLLTFMVSFETDFLRVLEMMQLSGITLRSSQRSAKWPIILASGLSVTANPLPLSSFMDAFIIGESEPSLGPVLDTIKSLGSQGAPKARILKWLSQLPGIYVPSIHGIKKPTTTIIRQWANTDGIGTISSIISADTSPEAMVMLELSRGCPFNCRFCMPGYIYLPYREKRTDDLEALLNSIPSGSRVGLNASSPSSHSCYNEVMEVIAKHDFEVLVANHSVDTLKYLENIDLDFDPAVINIHLEAGSESFRKVLGKNLKEQLIIDSIAGISRSTREIRLHFQVGLPFEMESDRDSIALVVKRIRKLTKVPITVNVNIFIPRPWTAFQWSEMIHTRDLRRWLEIIEGQLSGIRSVSVITESPREAHIRALLARGDHRVAIALEEKLKGIGWNTAFTRAGIDIGWVFTRLKTSTTFGWDFLNMGFGYTRLARELQLALSANQARQKDAEENSQ